MKNKKNMQNYSDQQMNYNQQQSNYNQQQTNYNQQQFNFNQQTPNIDKDAVRKKLIVRNLLVLILIAFAAVTLFLGTFFKISVDYKLNQESMQKLIGDEMKIPNISEETNLHIEIELTPALFFDILKQNNEEAVVKSIVDRQVDSLLVQAKPIISQIMKIYAKSLANDALENYKTKLLEENPDADIDQLLADNGMSPEKIEEIYVKSDEIIDKVIEGEVTVEEVTTDIVGLVDDASNGTLTDEEKEDIKTQVGDVLNEFTNPDGKIDIESALVKLLDGMTKEQIEALQDQETSVQSRVITATRNGETQSGTEGETEKTLNDLVYEKLMENLDANTINIISKIMKGIAIFLIIVIAILALGFVYILLRTLFAKRKGAGTFLYGFVTFLPFFILVIVPTLALMIIPNFVSGADEVLSLLTLQFSSMTICAFIASILLIILKIVFHKPRKQEKILKKQNML